MPIAIGLEEGSELLKSAAVVLIGGLLTSTLLTLVFIPAMYTIFDDAQAWVVRAFRAQRRIGPPPEELLGETPEPALAGGDGRTERRSVETT
jgi:hypothetical protein